MPRVARLMRRLTGLMRRLIRDEARRDTLGEAVAVPAALDDGHASAPATAYAVLPAALLPLVPQKHPEPAQG
jgi:hypothetical protein